METNNNQTEEQDLQLAKQDEGTVKILQADDLKTLNDAVEKVKTFKRKYTLKKLTVTDITDKSQIERLRLAIADVRTTKTGLEKDKKEKSKPYRDTVAYINTNYDKVIDSIELTILDPLKNHKKEIDQKIEDKEKEEEQKKELLLKSRLDQLKAAGMKLTEAGYYEVGSIEFGVDPITLGIVDIQGMTDTIFENVLGQVIEKAGIINEATEKEKLRIAEEKRLQEEKEAEAKRLLAEQQEQLRQQQAEFQRQQDEFKKQQRELQEAQEKMARMQQEEADRKLKAEQEELQKKEIQRQAKIAHIVDGRKKQVSEIGLILNPNQCQYEYNHTPIFEEHFLLDTSEENNWEKVFSDANNFANKLKEEKRIADLKQKKEEEDRITAKAIADKKLKDQEDERIRLENLAKAGDEAIWTDYVAQLKKVSVPDVKSKEFKAKVEAVEKYIFSLK